jgi:uncharacterized protein (TIRG00374 family)
MPRLQASDAEVPTAALPRIGAGGGTPIRWLKPLVSLLLYAAVFYFTDVSAIAARLFAARVDLLAACVLLYGLGQVLSAWRWQLLLGPVGLTVPLRRMVGFYFIGMFFNLFLPTIVGGDVVKAVLLSRETGAAARSTVSVFMERDVGLLALLAVASIAAWQAPDVVIAGLSLRTLTLLLSAGFVAVNVVLLRPAVYAWIDRLIARTPLAGMRGRAASLYESMTPYRLAYGVLAATLVLSLAFQAVVIAVVFFAARALSSEFPLTAVAVFVPLISLAGMIPVSLNGLGVREALYILLFGRVGASSEIAVSVALLYLAVTFLASLPGGIVYALYGPPASAMRAGATAEERR